MVAHAFNSSSQISELKDSLLYRASCRATRTTWRNHVSKKQTNKNEIKQQNKVKVKKKTGCYPLASQSVSTVCTPVHTYPSAHPPVYMHPSAHLKCIPQCAHTPVHTPSAHTPSTHPQYTHTPGQHTPVHTPSAYTPPVCPQCTLPSAHSQNTPQSTTPLHIPSAYTPTQCAHPQLTLSSAHTPSAYPPCTYPSAHTL